MYCLNWNSGTLDCETCVDNFMVKNGECIPTCEISFGHLGYVTNGNVCDCPSGTIEITTEEVD